MLFAVAVCASCTVSQKLALADKAYDQEAYARAAKRYRKVLPKLSRSREPEKHAKVLFHLAESSRLTGNTRQAEGLYERAITKSNPNPNPNAMLGLAKSQQANEKYAEAADTYAGYLKLVPQDSAVKHAMDLCLALRDSTVKQTRYLVEAVPDFNSNKDDFAPAFAEDDYSVVYFTSSRETALGRRSSIITGEKMTDIFFAKQARNGRWEKIQLIAGEINTKKADEGVCAFSGNLRTMYFTQCVSRGARPGCKICSASRSEENVWTEVDVVQVADSTANAAHPSLADDGTVLYFASDMPDGFGGFDIWMVNRLSEEEGWSEPVNLGKDINSAGNEMYPHIRRNGVLYFSSDGHGGYGGLDIFKATKKQEGGWHVENMGLPMNSAADDFSIIFERDGEAGYFASRRRFAKAKGGDDIYRFVLPEAKFMFIGSVREADELTPMADVSVNVITSAGTSTRYNTEKDGLVALQLQPETDYLVKVSKSGYFNQKTKFSTKGLEDITTLRDEFLMRSMAKAVELENILYDFGKFTLRPESEASLDNLVEVLNDNPTINIEIASHSDSRGDSTFNVQLSQKRAQAVVDYLVKKGIDASRLMAKGYGSKMPRAVSKSVAAQYKFLREGDVLSDDFLRKNIRTQEEEDTVDQLNRRTEFQVVSGVQ
jgi:peptidoglycan-associated lipoprotein